MFIKFTRRISYEKTIGNVIDRGYGTDPADGLWIG